MDEPVILLPPFTAFTISCLSSLLLLSATRELERLFDRFFILLLLLPPWYYLGYQGVVVQKRLP